MASPTSSLLSADSGGVAHTGADEAAETIVDRVDDVVDGRSMGARRFGDDVPATGEPV